MKNILIFTAGIVTGAVLMIFISLVFASNFSHNDMNLFENEGECISENSFEVFQVLDSGDALANEIEEKYSTSLHTGLVVLFLHENGKSYYDDQIIKIPSGKCVKQIGVYKYPTKDGFEKTVPIVDIRKNKHVMFWIKRPTPDRSAGCFCKIRCLSFLDNKIIVI